MMSISYINIDVMTYQRSLDVPPPGHDGLQRRVPDSQFAGDVIVPCTAQSVTQWHPCDPGINFILQESFSFGIRCIDVQGAQILQVPCADMPAHDTEKDILVVGALRQPLAEVNVTMLRSLYDFTDKSLYDIIYDITYEM